MEKFVDIKDYEGLYQISNFGNVKSLKFGKEKILKPGDSMGYAKVQLWKDKVMKQFKIHQLVAIAFLGHTRCGYNVVVNHIDGNKRNNNVSNLELISIEENTADGLLRNSNLSKDILNNIKYIGIKQWTAHCNYENDIIFLGTFETMKDAVIAIESANIVLNNIKLKNPGS